jgi:hypothetical protein
VYALPILGGLITGSILGVLTAFFQLIPLAALALGAQHLLILPLDATPTQDLLFNLAIYATVILIVFFLGHLGSDGPTRSRSFYRAFFVSFPLPGIWLMYAWPMSGH